MDYKTANRESALTTAQRMAEDFLEELINKYKSRYKNIKIKVKSTQRGTANYNSITITIPVAYTLYSHESELFLKIYIIHEFCHFKAKGHGHGYKFKFWEKRILRDYGFEVIYNKAYIKAYYDLDGNFKFNDAGENILPKNCPENFFS